MTITNRIQQILSVILTIIFGFFALISVGVIFEKDKLSDPVYLVLTILLFILTALSIWWFFSISKISRKNIRKKREKEILRIAKKNNGLIIPTDVALESHMSLNEVTTMLDTMYRKGLCDIRTADNGTTVYQFSGIISQKEKENSKGFSEL